MAGDSVEQYFKFYFYWSSEKSIFNRFAIIIFCAIDLISVFILDFLNYMNEWMNLVFKAWHALTHAATAGLLFYFVRLFQLYKTCTISIKKLYISMMVLHNYCSLSKLCLLSDDKKEFKVGFCFYWQMNAKQNMEMQMLGGIAVEYSISLQ